MTWAKAPKTAITRYSRPALRARRMSAVPRVSTGLCAGLAPSKPGVLGDEVVEMVSRSVVGLLVGSGCWCAGLQG